MRNWIIAILFVGLLGGSLWQEPTTDIIDGFSGATNATFNPEIDEIGGVSAYGEDDDDEDDDEHEEEEEDD